MGLVAAFTWRGAAEPTQTGSTFTTGTLQPQSRTVMIAHAMVIYLCSHK